MPNTQIYADGRPWALFRRYMELEHERNQLGDSHRDGLRAEQIRQDQWRIREALGAELFDRLAAEWL